MSSPQYISRDALEAFERRDYELVLRLAMPYAIEGNSDAQTTVALLYQCGLGVNRDVLEAEKWLLRAAENNNPVAWNNLGSLYASKVPELRHRWNAAQECYEKARQLGLSVAEPMIDELPIPEASEKDAPRWVQILAGLVLTLLTLLCAFASVSMLVIPNEKSPIVTVVVGLILLLGCLWVFEKCFRLLTGRKNRGGLMSPNTLRVVSFFFLAAPVGGLFTGYYRRMGPIAIFQAVMYFFGFLGLHALARKREAKGALDEQTKG